MLVGIHQHPKTCLFVSASNMLVTFTVPTMFKCVYVYVCVCVRVCMRASAVMHACLHV